MKLGVNIDHIATLRQARKECFPSPVEAAILCMKSGADGIVAHLREDRRHIQDNDIYAIRKAVKRFDMEMAATKEMQTIALKVKPDIITLVPEKRQEVTTEGGLDVVKQEKYLKSYISKLQDKGIIVSLFIDPVEKQIISAFRSGAKFIELHTGDYSRCPKRKELDRIVTAVNIAKSIGLGVNAGHGLDYKNVSAIAKLNDIEELNIGFSIIADAVFSGLSDAVRKMKKAIK